MGVRLPGVASRGYEEMQGANVPNTLTNNNFNQTEITGPDLELASVSVVPDGEFIWSYFFFEFN